MIIDLILDRKDGQEYNAKDFYNEISEYSGLFQGTASGVEIAEMLDNGTNKDVQKALCDYITENDYNPEIKDFVNSCNWI